MHLISGVGALSAISVAILSHVIELECAKIRMHFVTASASALNRYETLPRGATCRRVPKPQGVT